MILIRLPEHPPNRKGKIVAAAIKLHIHAFEFGFAVVTGDSIRIRRLLN